MKTTPSTNVHTKKPMKPTPVTMPPAASHGGLAVREPRLIANAKNAITHVNRANHGGNTRVLLAANPTAMSSGNAARPSSANHTAVSEPSASIAAWRCGASRNGIAWNAMSEHANTA